MAASAGTVTLDLDANSVKLLRELQKAERGTRNTTRKMSVDFRKMATDIAKTAAVAATAFAALTTKMTRDGMKAIDSQAKMARAVRGSLDALKSLQMAAGDSGLNDLEGSLTRLNRRLGAAEFGAGPAAVTVKALNLQLSELSKMDIDQRLQTIGQAIKDAGISGEQAARHLQNLGFEQAQAAEFFRSGITDLSGYRREIDGLGLSLSMIDAIKVEQANDALGVFGDVLSGIQQKLAVQFAPIIRQVSEDILQMAIGTDGFASAIDQAFNFAVRAAGVAANAFRALQLVLQALVVNSYAVRTAMAATFAFVLEKIAPVVDFFIAQINRLIAAVNSIPGINIPSITSSGGDMAGGMSAMAAGFQAEMQQAIAELQALWGKPWPSETIEAYVGNAREMAQRAAEEAAAAAESGFEGFVEEAETLTDRFKSIQEQAAKSMQSAFADFFFNPFENGLKGMAESFVNVVRRMIAEAMALRAIMALAGMGGPIGSFFSMALPSRDSGGRGVAGQPYMIGRGAQPEVFIPDSAGTFIPNADKLGGQSLTINVDARDEGAEARIRDMINREMAPQIIAAAKGSTVAALRRPRFA